MNAPLATARRPSPPTRPDHLIERGSRGSAARANDPAPVRTGGEPNRARGGDSAPPATDQSGEDPGHARFLAAEASEAERRRIRRFAADLRGELTLRAMSIRSHFGRLRRRAERSGVPFALDEVASLLDRADALLRDVRRELDRPPSDEAPFPTALKWLARRTERKHGVPVTVEFAGAVGPVDVPTGPLLYSATRRVLREMANGGADTMTLRLTSDGDSPMRLSVRAARPIAGSVSRSEQADSIARALGPVRRRVESAGGSLAVRQASPRLIEAVISVGPAGAAVADGGGRGSLRH